MRSGSSSGSLTPHLPLITFSDERSTEKEKIVLLYCKQASQVINMSQKVNIAHFKQTSNTHSDKMRLM